MHGFTWCRGSASAASPTSAATCSIHLIYLHPGFYEDNRSSEIQSRLTADTTLLQSVIGSSLSLFLRNLLMVIGGIILLFITNPKLTSIVVVALPLVIAPILIFGRRVRNLSRLSQDRIADIGSYVSETLARSRPCRPTTIRPRTSAGLP